MRFTLWFACAVTVLVLAGCGGNVQTAEGVVDSLAKGDFAGATKHFDSTMKATLTPKMLQQTWEAMTKAYGPLNRQGDAWKSEMEQAGVKYEVVVVPCEFEKATLQARVVFNDKKEIAGLFFVPPEPTPHR